MCMNLATLTYINVHQSNTYSHFSQGIGGKKRNGVRVGGGKIRMMGDPFGEFTRWEDGGHQDDQELLESNMMWIMMKIMKGMNRIDKKNHDMIMNNCDRNDDRNGDDHDTND